LDALDGLEKVQLTYCVLDVRISQIAQAGSADKIGALRQESNHQTEFEGSKIKGLILSSNSGITDSAISHAGDSDVARLHISVPANESPQNISIGIMLTPVLSSMDYVLSAVKNTPPVISEAYETAWTSAVGAMNLAIRRLAPQLDLEVQMMDQRLAFFLKEKATQWFTACPDSPASTLELALRLERAGFEFACSEAITARNAHWKQGAHRLLTQEVSQDELSSAAWPCLLRSVEMALFMTVEEETALLSADIARNLDAYYSTCNASQKCTPFRPVEECWSSSGHLWNLALRLAGRFQQWPLRNRSVAKFLAAMASQAGVCPSAGPEGGASIPAGPQPVLVGEACEPASGQPTLQRPAGLDSDPAPAIRAGEARAVTAQGVQDAEAGGKNGDGRAAREGEKEKGEEDQGEGEKEEAKGGGRAASDIVELLVTKRVLSCRRCGKRFREWAYKASDGADEACHQHVRACRGGRDEASGLGGLKPEDHRIDEEVSPRP
jgi:hypothetical protein